MKVYADKLAAELERGLRPVYIVSGDEPLLCGEAADAVRARARAAGYAEREVFFIERGGAVWGDVLAACETRSLFASRRLVELRFGGGRQEKPDEYIKRLLALTGEELMLLISTPKVDGRGPPGWLQQAEAAGVWVTIWPLRTAEFPDWLRRRMRGAGLDASEDAISLLAARTEGNLLAAQQEIDKLALLLGKGAKVDAAAVATGSADSARFNPFQVGEAVTACDAARALRIIAGLRAEGEDLIPILWSLQRARSQMPFAAADPRQRNLATRLALRTLRVDRMLKGRLQGDAWDELELLAVELCGKRPLPLQRWQLRAS
jgi:DNA polymerase III subunit delta